jgi:hypothetical protein
LPVSLRTLQPLLSFFAGGDDDDDDDDGAGAAFDPPVSVGARGAPASATPVLCAGTVTPGPPWKMGPSPPFSRSSFGGVQDGKQVAVPASTPDMIAPRKRGVQPQVHVGGQSESTLQEPVFTSSHVFHLSETHVLPGWQMFGIAIGGNVQPASALHVGIGGFGTPEQGMRSAVA